MPLATLMTRCPGAFLQRVTLRAHGWAAAVTLKLLPCSLHSAAWAHPSQAKSLKPHFSGPWRPAATAHCPQGRSLQARPLTGYAPSSTLHPPQLWRCSPHTPLHSHPWLSAHAPSIIGLSTSWVRLTVPTQHFFSQPCPLPHGLTETSAASRAPEPILTGGPQPVPFIHGPVPPHEPLLFLMTDVKEGSRVITERLGC